MIQELTNEEFINQFGIDTFTALAQQTVDIMVESEEFKESMSSVYYFAIVDAINEKTKEEFKLVVEANMDKMPMGIIAFTFERLTISDTGMDDEVLDRYHQIQEAKQKHVKP